MYSLHSVLMFLGVGFIKKKKKKKIYGQSHNNDAEMMIF